MLKQRAGTVPVVCFCIHEGPGRVAGKAYEKICRELGLNYVGGFDELCVSEQANGAILNGIENGKMIDSHLNMKGHALLGNWLADYLAGQKLVRP